MPWQQYSCSNPSPYSLLQMLLDDGFGKVMQRNVKVRQLLSPSPLQSLVGCFLSVCLSVRLSLYCVCRLVAVTSLGWRLTRTSPPMRADSSSTTGPHVGLLTWQPCIIPYPQKTDIGTAQYLYSLPAIWYSCYSDVAMATQCCTLQDRTSGVL